MTTKALPVYTLYDHPREYPTGYIVRIFRNAEPDSEPFLWGKSLHVIEQIMGEKGLMWLVRMPADDPVIMGTWI